MSWYDQPYIIIDGEYRCVINHGLPSMGTRRQYRCVINHGLPSMGTRRQYRCVIYHGLPSMGQTKDYTIGICYFSVYVIKM
jgi:hypothetical protein